MMKTLQDYIAEAADRAAGPVVGDVLAINLREDCLLETHVIETTDDGIVVAADDLFMSLLENYGCTTEEIAQYEAVAANSAQSHTMAEHDVDKEDDSDAELQLIRSRAGVAENDYDNKGQRDEVSEEAEHKVGDSVNVNSKFFGKQKGTVTKIDKQSIHVKRDGKKFAEKYPHDAVMKEADDKKDADDKNPPFDADDEPSSDKDQFGNTIKNKARNLARKGMAQTKDVKEAEYQGRKVQLNKPMSGDVKKSKVYVKDPGTGNVKKVNFGDPNMKIKKSNPDRRKSFRARHKCDTAKDKTTARYWSCRAW